MGLDMYLTRRTFVGNEYRKPEERVGLVVPAGLWEPYQGWARAIRPERISYIIEQVGYWRKANAIHAWFVREVQDGEDDCREYPVSGEKLRELLRVVEEVLGGSSLVDGEIINGYSYQDGKRQPILELGKVIRDPARAAALLPTQSGFFFGGTDYDQYYVQDLEETKEMLEGVLAEDPKGDGEYYYHTSW